MKKVTKTTTKYIPSEDLKEQARNIIKQFMALNNVNASGLAQKLNELDSNRSNSRTNILNKLARASFQLTEIIQIVDAFGYELKIVPKTPIEDIPKKH